MSSTSYNRCQVVWKITQATLKTHAHTHIKYEKKCIGTESEFGGTVHYRRMNPTENTKATAIDGSRKK